MTARICKLKGKLPKKVYDRMMKQYKRETKDIIRIRDLYSGGSIAIVYVFKDTKRHRGKWSNKDNAVRLYKPYRYCHQELYPLINPNLIETYSKHKAIKDELERL